MHIFFCIPGKLFKLFGVELARFWSALYTCDLEILNLTCAAVDCVQRLSGKFSALEPVPPQF